MRLRPYPPDGGLKEPAREFGDTFSAFEVIRRHFLSKKDDGPIAQ